MRILLTNDDGINAKGLSVLESIATHLSDDIGISAPMSERSGASHSVSISAPLRIEQRGNPLRLAVDGSPADSVLVGLTNLWPDGKAPDLVLSGINHGENIAGDVQLSGTVGAAEQAAQNRIRSIALSQGYEAATGLDWSPVATHGLAAIRALLSLEWPEDGFFSLNFPARPQDAPDLVITQSHSTEAILKSRELFSSPYRRKFAWLGPSNADLRDGDVREHSHAESVSDTSDIKILNDGCIAATPLRISRDHEKYLLTSQGKRISL